MSIEEDFDKRQLTEKTSFESKIWWYRTSTPRKHNPSKFCMQPARNPRSA